MAELHQTEKRTLRYDFNEKELLDLSFELAQKNNELEQLEDEKKSVSSNYKAKMDEKQARIRMLSQLVNNRYDWRDIECHVEFNSPVPGKKTVYRKDNNEKVGEEAMTDYEWNLFNQPKEDGAEEGDGQTAETDELPFSEDPI